MIFSALYIYRYHENCFHYTSNLECRIKYLLKFIDSYFISDISVNFFFSSERFSSITNFRSIINRYLMCSLLEYYLPLLSSSTYGYTISVSSSHTAEAGVVGFSVSNTGLRIGLDIEHIDRIIPVKVASYISNKSDHLSYSDNFLRYWVLKESIFKSKFNLLSIRDVHLSPLFNQNFFNNLSVFNDGYSTLATDLKIDDHLIGFSLGDFQC
jgi:hypothetical protein